MPDQITDPTRAALLIGDFFEDRGDHLAWAAPLSPEVDQNGRGSAADLLVKGAVVDGPEGSGHG